MNTYLQAEFPWEFWAGDGAVGQNGQKSPNMDTNSQKVGGLLKIKNQ